MSVCNNFAGFYILNEQARKDTVQHSWSNLQGKCTHGDIDLICILIRSGVIGSTFTVYAIGLTRKISLLWLSAAIFLWALSGVLASMSWQLGSVTLLEIKTHFLNLGTGALLLAEAECKSWCSLAWLHDERAYVHPLDNAIRYIL